VGFDRTLNPVLVSDIHSRAAALLPRLAACRPAEAWLGFRPAASASEPVVGRAGGMALWLAYGHYRNGILMAPATALRVATSLIEAS
jgi:glycine oxidase